MRSVWWNLRSPFLNDNGVDQTSILDILTMVLELLVGESGLQDVVSITTGDTRSVDERIQISNGMVVVEPRDQPGSICKPDLDTRARSTGVDVDTWSGRLEGSSSWRWSSGARRLSGSHGAQSLPLTTKWHKLLLRCDVILFQTLEYVDISGLARLNIHQAQRGATALDSLQDLAVRRVVITHQGSVLNAESVTPEGKGASDGGTRSWHRGDGVGDGDRFVDVTPEGVARARETGARGGLFFFLSTALSTSAWSSVL